MRLAARLSLGVAVLLLGFELSMLGIGLFGARVSPEYQAYFIDQRVALWGNEVAQPDGLTSR